ncbi:Beta,beta-carotene 9',10'-oxygenase [Orchesella cincta]|uniref:Beta,beta-carotene 9',10'-oxygenase n=1 Tax=Orchesella cincta TaxID=48709 RepID=A0A1D2MGB8_ORCCI|nr:Beta,beta-carotene 9',10'-oxygenase [Orchesella cincta]
MAQLNFKKIFSNQDDMSQPENATILGNVPNWISGSYIRVGPGKFDIGDTTMTNFIDGYAILTKFDIRNGLVQYNKKFIQSDAYKKAIQTKQPVYPEFATKGNLESSKSLLSRVMSAFSSSGITDNDPINLYCIEGEIFASSESCHIHCIKKSDLATSNKVDLYKYFGVHMACAHPQRDNKGDLYLIGTSFTTGCKYQVIKIPPVGSGTVKDALKKGSIIASIYPSWATCCSYYHTFAMTENYIVLIEQPLLMNVVKLAEAKMKGKAIRDVMEWCPTEKNRFFVIDKRTGEVLKTKYYADKPFFFFHYANAYEEDDHIIMDIDAYPNENVLDVMNMVNIRNGNFDGEQSGIVRFALPITKNVKDHPKGGNIVRLPYTRATARRENDTIVLHGEELGELGLEGPTVTPLRRHKKHRYIYGTGTFRSGFHENALSKLDLETGESIVWRDANYFFPGEPEFLPLPDAKDEDDGIILSAVSDGRDNGQDFLLMIDAKTMKEVGRAMCNSQIPQCIHGTFFPDKSMKKSFPPSYILF